MKRLVFQLQAPLASWGATAVGGYRGSVDYPGISAIVGLLGAALGVRRENEDAHAALRDGYGFAVGVVSGGQLLRDYHTAQAPGRAALKGRAHVTRKDELSVPKEDLNTILSTRDYRQNVSYLVAVEALDTAPHALQALMQALTEPRFTLYLGRKSCPPAAPLHPQLIEAESVLAGFEAYRSELAALIASKADRRGRLPLRDKPMAPISRLAWDGAIGTPGVQADLTVQRKDRLIRRRGWQFGDRIEYIAELSDAPPPSINLDPPA